jgi:hypothetical protein
MKFLITILAIKTAITLISNKSRFEKSKPVAGKRVEHPAEMQLR